MQCFHVSYIKNTRSCNGRQRTTSRGRIKLPMYVPNCASTYNGAFVRYQVYLMWSTGSAVEGRRMCALEPQLLFFCGMTAYSRIVETVLIIVFEIEGAWWCSRALSEVIKERFMAAGVEGSVIAATDPWHCPALIDLTSTLHRSYHTSISSKCIKCIDLHHQNSFQRVYGAPAADFDASQLRLPAPGPKYPRRRNFLGAILKMSFVRDRTSTQDQTIKIGGSMTRGDAGRRCPLAGVPQP